MKDIIKSIESSGTNVFGGGLSTTKPHDSDAKKQPSKAAKTVVTYLNVHAGVGMGVMAGLDVGAVDRFEVRTMFLMVGPPPLCGCFRVVPPPFLDPLAL